MIQVFILGGLAIGSLFAAGCTPPKPTRPKDPDPKLDFDPEDNPLAQSFSESLAKQGISLLQLDQGYRVINYSGIHCPDAKALWCRLGVGDKRLQAEEILENVFDHHEDHSFMIKEHLGKFLPVELDDLDPKTTFDEAIRKRIESEIAEIRSILESQGLQENSEDYREKLAVGLYYLVTLPDAEELEIIKNHDSPFFEIIFAEMKGLGLEKYYHALTSRGGLRPKISNHREEYSVLESLQYRQGECTELSKILYAIFRMAGLQSQFVFVERSGFKHSNPKLQKSLQNYLNVLPEGMQHICLGLPLKGKLRLFDPSLLDSNAQHHPAYHLSLRQYLSFDYSNACSAWSKKGQFDRAMTECNTAIWLDSYSPLAHINRGVTMLLQNRLDEAMEDYNKADELYPGFYMIHLNRGEVWYWKNELDKAQAEFEEAFRLNPKSAWLHAGMGMLWKARGDLAKAKESYETALGLNPQSAEAHYALGELLVEQQLSQEQPNFDQGLVSFQTALEIEPSHALAHFRIAFILYKKGNTEKAVHHLKQTIQYRPNFSNAYYDLGMILMEKGDLDQALPYLQKAIELKPDLAEAHLLIGKILYRQGQLDKAEQSFTQAIQHQADYAEAYFFRGLLRMRKKDWVQAEQDLNSAVTHRQDFAEAYSVLGLVLEQKGDLAKAEDYHAEAIRQNPSLPMSYFNRGGMYLRQGKFDAAIADFSQFITSDPNRPDGYYGRASAYVKKRDWNHAITDFESLLKLNDQDRMAFYGLGALFVQKGEVEKALDPLTKFIALVSNKGPGLLLKGLPKEIEARWEHDAQSKKIAQDFRVETEGGNLAGVEAYFVASYVLWKSGNHDTARLYLSTIPKNRLDFKKQPSQTTKVFFSKMLNLMPSEMGQDPEIKKIVLEIKKKL